MCGITGFIGLNVSEALPHVVRDMSDAILHRGPDGGGVWGDETCGGARLTIRRQLESQNDQSPFTNRWLQAWRGHSDMETLLTVFATWGIEKTLDLCRHVLCALNIQERVLTLARDRMGEKPLYFDWQDHTLMVASELKALKAHPAFRPEINRQALTLLFRFNYIPSPFSICRYS